MAREEFKSRIASFAEINDAEFDPFDPATIRHALGLLDAMPEGAMPRINVFPTMDGKILFEDSTPNAHFHRGSFVVDVDIDGHIDGFVANGPIETHSIDIDCNVDKPHQFLAALDLYLAAMAEIESAKAIEE